ncbi:MAG: ABC transporter permease [Nocardioidaceae bacterium]|nr:ABC transporter permease [Nocardioidaceae bacterium]
MSATTTTAPEVRLRGAAVPTALTLLVVLACWQVAVPLLDIPVYVLPSPTAILAHADWSAIVSASGSTSVGVVLGFVAGNLLGFVLAGLIAWSAAAASVLYPIGLSLRSVPIIALAPFITLAVGRGVSATTTVAGLIVFFPTLVNVLAGFRSVEREALELMRVLNASKRDVFVRVQLPAALPLFFDALKIAAPTSVLGVMTAEWVIGGHGLGQLILTESLALNGETMWGGIVASAVIAGLAFTLVSLAERLLIPWAGDQ